MDADEGSREWLYNPATALIVPRAQNASMPYLGNYLDSPPLRQPYELDEEDPDASSSPSDDMLEFKARRCARWSLITVSSLITLSGLVGVCAALLSPLSGCPDCGSAVPQEAGVSALLCVYGIGGIVLGGIQSRPLFIAFGVLTGVIDVVLTVVAFLFLRNEWTRALWKWTVDYDSSLICQAQQRLGCSGFDLPCTSAFINTTFSRRDNCAAQCNSTNHHNTEPCSTHFDNRIPYVTSAALAVAAVFVVALVMAARSQRRRDS